MITKNVSEMKIRGGGLGEGGQRTLKTKGSISRLKNAGSMLYFMILKVFKTNFLNI